MAGTDLFSMELRHLRSFLTVAHHCGVTRASVELGYSQQAISLHIAAVERELGVRLFARERGGCALTEAGVDLLCRVIGPVTALDAVNPAEFARRYGADGNPLAGALISLPTVPAKLSAGRSTTLSDPPLEGWTAPPP